jgi:cob(I)alamin adenosyltransferase
MTPIYKRSGDDGSTGLLGQSRLPKYHPRMETLGALDEASAALGLARALSKEAQTESLMKNVQHDLYIIMTEVAATPGNAKQFRRLDQSRVLWLESQTDAISASAPIPTEFIMPGDSVAGGSLALARTIVRRAERRAAELLDSGEIENRTLLQYLNRLSSLCFALEVFENFKAGKPTSLAKEL